MESLGALVTAILTALGIVAAPSSPPPKAIAHGAVGHDISWPQCGGGTPSPSGFGIVGVTGGKPYEENPCLAAQYAWAKTTPGGAGFYMNTANPGTATVALNWYGQKSPDPSCAPGKDAACAYNYGFNAAARALSYAQAQTGTSANAQWWLDVETTNSWSTNDLGANLASIRGSLDFLQRVPGVAVGIYSTRYQWTRITGGAPIAVPNWIAGARNLDDAKARCAPSWSATGGPVVLNQFVAGFDTNYAC
jgi:hypothetical protein